ncbi:MAG: TrbC/VirB2 family protein [Candidatus Eremiobacteraeota bacterium]|nr:TrbC/VirB2 family protein [Candidatus Eremiobacteraeota bacterium]
MKSSEKSLRVASVMLPAFFLAAATAASANITGGGPGGGGAAGTLPWETILQSLTTALTGKTAQLICVIAIFVAGIALIFGEDLGHFAKRLLMIVIAAAFIIGAGGFVTNFVAGAHI